MCSFESSLPKGEGRRYDDSRDAFWGLSYLPAVPSPDNPRAQGALPPLLRGNCRLSSTPYLTDGVAFQYLQESLTISYSFSAIDASNCNYVRRRFGAEGCRKGTSGWKAEAEFAFDLD